MLAKGLLVEDRNGQEYLLSVNEQGQSGPPDVRISRRIAGQWVLMEVTEPPVSSVREGVIGALLDFFTGICRILYQSDNRSRSQRTRLAVRSRVVPS
ncbi:MAG: hypothetical protein EPO61_15235 [Nitrospirae bacterium]|nr:MAG: hypothetical protein EPO61_15235 [Nitrospirota bacterium]